MSFAFTPFLGLAAPSNVASTVLSRSERGVKIHDQIVDDEDLFLLAPIAEPSVRFAPRAATSSKFYP